MGKLKKIIKRLFGKKEHIYEEEFMVHIKMKTVVNANNVLIVASGRYGIGSAGNDDGKLLNDEFAKYIATENIQSITVDLSKMHYEWGNGIVNMFLLSEEHENIDIKFILNKECYEAWNGLLSFLGSNWQERNIKFE